MNLGSDWELDLGLRGVGPLPHPSVPSYVELDARIGWRIFDNLEISLAGFNLFDASHPEFGTAPTRGELRRSFTLNTRWTF
jgi:iron complex outermembrane receptor protein